MPRSALNACPTATPPNIGHKLTTPSLVSCRHKSWHDNTFPSLSLSLFAITILWATALTLRELKPCKCMISAFLAAPNACALVGHEHAYLFLFIQILSVQKVSNCGTNSLPIQALTGETECCDLEHLIHPAQSLQSALRDPQGHLWGPVDLWPSFLTRSTLIVD
jgi:hypothetical protein